MVGITAYRIGNAVIHHIHHDKNICASYGFIDDGLALACSESGTAAVKQIGIHVITAVVKVLLAAHQFLYIIAPELYNMVVHLGCKILQLSSAAIFKGATGRESLNTKLLAMIALLL